MKRSVLVILLLLWAVTLCTCFPVSMVEVAQADLPR